MGIKASIPSGSASARNNTNPVTPEDDIEEDMTAQWLTQFCGVPRRRLTMLNKDGVLLPGRLPTIDVCPEEQEPLPQEEILRWSKSFDHLMQNKGGQRVFKEYLESEFSVENILFWQACEDLKLEKDPEIVDEKARIIFEDYVSGSSPREVSLDGQVKEIIDKNMLKPTIHAFDEAQLQIYMLMQRDSYPRFLNSQIFLRLLEQ